MSLSETVVLSARPEGVSLARGGVVVAIRRAPLHGPVLGELRRAVDAIAPASPRGIVHLSTYRLSPRFPLKPGFDSNIAELADHLRALDRWMAASAAVIEFGGVRAAAMRVAARAVVALARPKCAIATFDRMSDALVWLAPHARRVGAADDAATYLALYRQADRMLADMDELEAHEAMHAAPK